MKRSVLVSFIVLTMLLMVLPLSDNGAGDRLGSDVGGASECGSEDGDLLGASGSRNISFTMGTTSSNYYNLSGTVETIQGPLALANVNLSNSSPGGESPPNQTTDADGSFSFENVLEGEYTMLVTRDGYSEFQNVYKNINITEDTELEYIIVMREAFGSISGTVCNGTFMISNALVTLVDSNDDPHATASTNSNGFYEFKKIPTGTYTLKVTRNGYENMESVVTVSSSDNKTVDFDLPNLKYNYLFGLDMPHSMMLIGAFMGGCLLLMAIGFRIQMGETPEMLYLKSLEDEEDEDSP